MKKSKTNQAKFFADLLFQKNKEVLASHPSGYNQPLSLIAAAALTTLSLFPLLSKIIKEKPSFLRELLKEYEDLLISWLATEKIALIQTALPLSSQEKAILAKRLTKIFGYRLKLKIEVKPELIGGLIIKVGGKVIDRSLLGRMEKLKEHLKG